MEFDLAFAGVGGAFQKRMQHEAKQHPARGKGDRRADQHGEQRRRPQPIECEEGAEARQHQELAVGEVQHTRYAVLQIEADRDQRIDAADDQAREQEIEHYHTTGTASGLKRSLAGYASELKEF